MSQILSIDIGTSYITTSYFNNGIPNILLKMPSVIQYGFMGNKIIGDTAKERKIGNRENTIDNIKRFIGLSYKDAVKESQKYTFDIFKNENNFFIDAFYTLERTENILSSLIKEAVYLSHKKTGITFNEAVITSPASYTSKEREILKYATESAGLTVRKIINEPTSATLFHIYKNGIQKQKIAVCNFGGGMFDFSIINFNSPNLQILSTNGYSDLGGIDLIDSTVKLILELFEIETNIKLNLNSSLLLKAEMYNVAEQVLHNLSYSDSTFVNIQNVARSNTGNIIDLNIKVSRKDFENKIKPYIKKIIQIIDKTFSESKVKVKDISKIIFSGGCTRIPLVRESIRDYFISNIYLNNNSKINQIFYDSFNKNIQDIVALGGAIQTGIISGKIRNIYIKDIVTKSLGIKTYYDKFSEIISQGEILPIQNQEIYTTVYNYQERLEVEILQGGKSRASQNSQLGKFYLKDIERAKAGIPKIKVCFAIDESGIFNVKAEDMKTGSEYKMLVEQPSWKF